MDPAKMKGMIMIRGMKRITGIFLSFLIFMSLSACGIFSPHDDIRENDGPQTGLTDTEPVIPVIEKTEGPEGSVSEEGPDDGEGYDGDIADYSGDRSDDGEQQTGTDMETDDVKNSGFYMTEITDEIFARIYGKSFKEECTLPREDLRYLHVLHKDIYGKEHEGEMIVNVHIAEDVLDILKELYENDYPIEKIRLVDEYDADDELSMEDNNSSCFNFRYVPRTKKISKHGMGLAVDINTFYNPYITMVDGKQNVDPKGAEPFADRELLFDYKIEKGDLCYNLFIAHGFEWGGEWKNSKDYQHFEIPSATIRNWYP